MKRNILIDPRMFQIKDENEIENNLCFFQCFIDLLKKKKLTIVLYNDLYQRILNRHHNPFPISFNNITNKDLKTEIKLINESFYTTILSDILSVDIEDCGGEQSFSITPDLKSNDEYLALFYVMLGNCYRDDIFIEPFVLCGNLTYELYDPPEQINELCINCNCDIRKPYSETFVWTAPSIFDDEEPDSLQLLQRLIEKQSNLYVDKPAVMRADHHLPFQNKAIRQYDDISARNKPVLALLRYFGLKKIIFMEFHHENKKSAGTITVTSIEKAESHDILTGWLYCEQQYKTEVQLYFPKQIGELLASHCENEFSYQKVIEIKEKFFS